MCWYSVGEAVYLIIGQNPFRVENDLHIISSLDLRLAAQVWKIVAFGEWGGKPNTSFGEPSNLKTWQFRVKLWCFTSINTITFPCCFPFCWWRLRLMVRLLFRIGFLLPSLSQRDNLYKYDKCTRIPIHTRHVFACCVTNEETMN